MRVLSSFLHRVGPAKAYAEETVRKEIIHLAVPKFLGTWESEFRNWKAEGLGHSPTTIKHLHEVSPSHAPTTKS